MLSLAHAFITSDHLRECEEYILNKIYNLIPNNPTTGTKNKALLMAVATAPFVIHALPYVIKKCIQLKRDLQESMRRASYVAQL